MRGKRIFLAGLIGISGLLAAPADGGALSASIKTTSASKSKITPAVSKTLSGALSSYLSSGISSPLSTATPTGATDSSYETFYWPWCFENDAGELRLDDPADLYGCASGTCACTGDEAPIDMRQYLDSDLGAVSVNSSGHFTVGGKERRYIGTVFSQGMTQNDLGNDTQGYCTNYDFVDCAQESRLIIKRLALTGHNLVRFMGTDRANMFDESNAVETATLAEVADHIQALGDEKIAVNLNLMASRVVEETGTSTDNATDGDGIISPEEMRCSATSTSSASSSRLASAMMSKELSYISDDFSALATQWAGDILAASPGGTGTVLASNPAVAMIEIANENPFTYLYASDVLGGLSESECDATGNEAALTDYWADELERDWRDWLEAKYASFAALETAWAATTATDLLDGYNGDFEDYNPASDSSLLLGSAEDSGYSGSATTRKLFSNWDFSNVNRLAPTYTDTQVAAACDTADCSDASRRVQTVLDRGTDTSWTYADFNLIYKGYGSADATGLITDYNTDADADGTVESDEALMLEQDQTYQVKMTYRITDYADAGGGGDCTPQVRAWLRDDTSGGWVMDDAYALDTDDSGSWHEYRANLTPAADYSDAQIRISLGSDCARVTLEVAEVNLYQGAIYGLKEEETDFDSVEIIPFGDRSLMSEARFADTVEFMMSREEGFYQKMRRAIRDAGFKGPVQNTNCFYNMPNFATRDTVLSSADYSGSDYVFNDAHAYWDSGEGIDGDGDGSVNVFGDGDYVCYHGKSLVEAFDSADLLTGESSDTAAEVAGDQTGESLAGADESVETESDDTVTDTNPITYLAHTAAAGMPFLTDEFAVNIGNPMMAEGLLLMAVQSSFQDWDGFTYWGYQYLGNAEVHAFMSEYRHDGLSYSMTHPLLAALMPIASLIVRNDYAETTAETLTIAYSDNNVIDHFNQGLNVTDQTVPGLPSAIALTYPLRLEAGGASDRDADDYAAQIAAFEADAADLKVSSTDGVVTWDFADRYFKLNAEKAQGFVGFISGKNYAADNFAVRLENTDYAVVAAASLDDKAISKSTNLWVTATSYAQNDGMESLRQEAGGQICYAYSNIIQGFDYYQTGNLVDRWRGPGDTYDESAGTGYFEAAFPQGVMAFDLGSTAVSAKAYAVDALGRTAEVTLTPSSVKTGYYIMEFNRAPYAFASASFPAGGDLTKTPWFRIEVTRDSDGDGIDDDHDPNPSRTNSWNWVNSSTGTTLTTGDASDGKSYTFLSGSYADGTYSVTGIVDSAKAGAGVFKDCEGSSSSSTSSAKSISTKTAIAKSGVSAKIKRASSTTYGACIQEATSVKSKLSSGKTGTIKKSTSK